MFLGILLKAVMEYVHVTKDNLEEEHFEEEGNKIGIVRIMLHGNISTIF